MRHNNALPNSYLRKHWRDRIKTWFDQPGRKKRRRLARVAKAKKISPRPDSGPIRPVVQCPTLKHNSKTRFGRGFTLDELKAAKLSKRYARTVGIAVDFRRKNKSAEAMEVNVNRLRKYVANLVVFPKKSQKPTEQQTADIKLATQYKGDIYPILKEKTITTFVPKSQIDRSVEACKLLRKARGDIRNLSFRKKKQSQVAAAAT